MNLLETKPNSDMYVREYVRIWKKIAYTDHNNDYLVGKFVIYC